jgi:imidazole glycerol phosphate synthase subunit HisF
MLASINAKGDIMAREKAFVKISGDLFQRRDVIQWIKELAKKYHVVLCVGGGN